MGIVACPPQVTIFTLGWSRWLSRFTTGTQYGPIAAGVRSTIQWAKRAFKNQPVVYVMGNHEYYGSEMPRVFLRTQKEAEGSNFDQRALRQSLRTNKRRARITPSAPFCFIRAGAGPCRC
jgi:hypothetical protein